MVLLGIMVHCSIPSKSRSKIGLEYNGIINIGESTMDKFKGISILNERIEKS